MRIGGALMIIVLLAAAVVFYLSGESATSSLDAVAVVATGLREEGVTGAALDRQTAMRMIAAMDELIATPDMIADHLADLRVFAGTAASWADAAPSPSSELHAAVALRGAADELRAYGVNPRRNELARAQSFLGEARLALSGEAPGPGLATEGVRDRLENLQRSQREKVQEVEEELNR